MQRVGDGPSRKKRFRLASHFQITRPKLDDPSHDATTSPPRALSREPGTSHDRPVGPCVVENSRHLCNGRQTRTWSVRALLHAGIESIPETTEPRRRGEATLAVVQGDRRMRCGNRPAPMSATPGPGARARPRPPGVAGLRSGRTRAPTATRPLPATPVARPPGRAPRPGSRRRGRRRPPAAPLDHPLEWTKAPTETGPSLTGNHSGQSEPGRPGTTWERRWTRRWPRTPVPAENQRSAPDLGR